MRKRRRIWVGAEDGEGCKQKNLWFRVFLLRGHGWVVFEGMDLSKIKKGYLQIGNAG